MIRLCSNVEVVSNFRNPKTSIFIRTSATNVVFTVYNNSDFTGVYRTQTESSLSSSITGLRYFKVANWHQSGSGSASFTGTMDNLQLWDHEGCKNDASSTSELDGKIETYFAIHATKYMKANGKRLSLYSAMGYMSCYKIYCINKFG